MFNIVKLDALSTLQRHFGKFNLIYLDPPFYTQRNFKDFTDKWDNMAEYIAILSPIFREAYEHLSDDGALVVHCDYHAVHYIRMALDGIFDEKNFANEFITMRAAKNAKNVARRLFTEEDRLLVFWRTEKGRIVLPPQKPRNPNAAEWAGLTGGGSGPAMKFGERWIEPRTGRHFSWKQSRINEQWDLGNIRISPNDNVTYRILSDTITVGTVWNDIPSYAHKHDYSTEKHPELMRRLINMYTKKGDTIGDFFMGSGVMSVEAVRMGRIYIGSDISVKSINTTLKRMNELFEAKIDFDPNEI